MTSDDKSSETRPDAAQGDEAPEPAPQATPPTGGSADTAAKAAPGTDLGDRMESFGREAAAAGERFGREAQAAGERLQRDPGLVEAANWASRAWGLLILAVGLWFFADVTLGLDMPSLAWRDLWPLVLILVGLAIVLRGLARRR